MVYFYKIDNCSNPILQYLDNAKKSNKDVVIYLSNAQSILFSNENSFKVVNDEYIEINQGENCIAVIKIDSIMSVISV